MSKCLDPLMKLNKLYIYHFIIFKNNTLNFSTISYYLISNLLFFTKQLKKLSKFGTYNSKSYGRHSEKAFKFE